MDLVSIGEFVRDNSENRLVRATLRCLGFTALGVIELLDYVHNDDMAGSVGFEPTLMESKSTVLPLDDKPL